MPKVSAGSSPISLAAIETPAQKYVIFDSGYVFLENPAQAITSPHYKLYVPGMGDGGGTCFNSSHSHHVSDCESGRHFGGNTVSFADGHVKWLKASVMVAQAKKFEDDKSNSWGTSDPTT